MQRAGWPGKVQFNMPASDMKPVLPSGVGVGIVAPSGYVQDERELTRAITRLEASGCHVKNYYDPTSKFQRFGGTDNARAAQLHAAINDPEIQLVISLRGGYGMSRILPQLDIARIAASGKHLVGHSDFTALQMALLAAGRNISFCGPMICPDFGREDISDFTIAHFWQCLTQSAHTIVAQAEGNPTVNVEGMLWGGNLTMLTHLMGTPYWPQIDGGILFIEDINEHPYRVERMLLQLLHAGVLARQKAVVLGDFSGYRLTDYDNGYDFVAMLAFMRSQLAVPILTSLPFGHIRDKVTLAVGADASLVSSIDRFELMMRGYPAL